LFKFDTEDANAVNDTLSQYKLASFQHRTLARVFTFANRALTTSASPPLLHEQFKYNHERGLRGSTLRNAASLYVPMAKTDMGTRTSVHFFSKFCNDFDVSSFGKGKTVFKTFVDDNINNLFTKMLAINCHSLYEKYNTKTKYVKHIMHTVT
jgi:hypothetical protein